MGDKLSSGTSVQISFSEGEIPSPAKLSAISAQLVRVADHLETAVGDVRGQSWPYTSASTTSLSQKWGKNRSTGFNLSGTAERFLDIANLARLVGPASNLNPKMINGSTTLTEDVPIGVHEFSLKHPVSGAVSGVTTTDTSMTTRVNPTAMTTAGDWSVTAGGKVRSVTATAGGTITYLTNSVEWAGGINHQRSRFNVIPDPNQVSNGTGCTVGALDGNGRRVVSLPTITHQQSDIDGTSITLDADDINYLKQLALPRVLTDDLIAGDQIPSGFLFLKNATTNEVYESATYYYNDEDSYLIGDVDLADAISAGNVFCTLTVGTDITTSIDDLRDKLLHSHDRAFGEPYVAVDGIIGQLEEPGLSGAFGPSDMDGNFFPQYLHRDGYRPTKDQNINDSNCMRGNLVIGKSGGSAGSYTGATGETFKVQFGGVDDENPLIKKDSNGDFYFYHGDGNADILFDIATPGAGSQGKLIVEPRLQANKGILGDLVGTVGALGTNGLALYATTTTFTTDAVSAAGVATVTLGNATLPSKTWYNVMLAVEVPGATTTWLSQGNWNTTGAAIINGNTADNAGYLYWWEEVAGVSTLYISLDPNIWSAATVYDCRLIIWYQP